MGRQITVTNQSGGEDSFTFTNGGLVLGGPLVPTEPGGSGKGLFYFISAEGQNINATKEESFAVPTVEQRGIFGSGATGLSVDPFSGQACGRLSCDSEWRCHLQSLSVSEQSKRCLRSQHIHPGLARE